MSDTFGFFLVLVLFVFAGFFGASLDNIRRRLKALEKLLQTKPEKQEEKNTDIAPTKTRKRYVPVLHPNLQRGGLNKKK